MSTKKRAKQNGAEMLVLRCDTCEQPRGFAVCSIYKTLEEPPQEYTFAYCSNCGDPSLFYREDKGDGFENDSYYRLFPPQERHISSALPKVVRDSYEESVRCESARTQIACVVMVGRTLEAVCQQFEPSARSILKGLTAMRGRGIISQELLDWANELRVLRNLGAHATDQNISRADAKSALDFLQAILEILYDLRPKFEEFKLRRTSGQIRGASDSSSDESSD